MISKLSDISKEDFEFLHNEMLRKPTEADLDIFREQLLGNEYLQRFINGSVLTFLTMFEIAAKEGRSPEEIKQSLMTSLYLTIQLWETMLKNKLINKKQGEQE